MDLFDVFQQAELDGLSRRADAQGSRVEGLNQQTLQLQQRLNVLERRHEQLKLVTLALWELLRERHGLSEAVLTARLREIDGRDGQVDGRCQPPRQMVRCQRCPHQMTMQALACPYCGAANPQAGGLSHV